MVIPRIYDDATIFSNGYAIVVKDDLYGCIDTKGNYVVDLIYYSAEDLISGESVKVIRDGKLIDVPLKDFFDEDEITG